MSDYGYQAGEAGHPQGEFEDTIEPVELAIEPAEKRVRAAIEWLEDTDGRAAGWQIRLPKTNESDIRHSAHLVGSEVYFSHWREGALPESQERRPRERRHPMTRRFRMKRTFGARFRNHPKLRFANVPEPLIAVLAAVVDTLRGEVKS